MNNFNIPGDKMDNLLNLAGKKLGQDPAALKSQLESGNISDIMAKLDPKTREQAASVINNPAQLESLMANEKIKKLFSSFMGEK